MFAPERDSGVGVAKAVVWQKYSRTRAQVGVLWTRVPEHAKRDRQAGSMRVAGGAEKRRAEGGVDEEA